MSANAAALLCHMKRGRERESMVKGYQNIINSKAYLYPISFKIYSGALFTNHLYLAVHPLLLILGVKAT